MLQKWKRLSSQMAFDHRWYKVRQDCVQLPDGQIVDDYFVSVRPDVAMVLPVTPQQQVVMVRQYRHGAGEILLELPAGTFDPQQEPAARAAERELREETGYAAARLEALATLYDNPVKETNRIHLFLAKDVCRVGDQQLDRTEEIEVVTVPITEIEARIQSGEIQVAGTLATLYLGLPHLNTR
ncbi:MAG: NUDIX hydrolase [Cyanobacteria bacterium J06648_16]